jgi:hypothetical protein
MLHQSGTQNKPEKTGPPVKESQVKAPETEANAACSAVCGESVCQRESGHTGKHREDGVSWTNAGAERLKKELTAKAGEKA